MSEIAYGVPTAPMEGNLPLTFGSDDVHWLELSRQSYRESEDWFNASMRRELEDAQKRFNSEHPASSKYHTEQFAKRSKLHRPKVRTAIRNIEAKASVAAFATSDVVHCGAPNEQNEAQVLGAKVHKSVLNYRLNNGDVPWYMIFTGGVQLAEKDGTVLSKQTWEFREIETTDVLQMRDVMTGERWTEEQKTTKIVSDKPCIDLVPLENFRFHPAAKWHDVIGTSAYLIHEEPVRIGEIKQAMEESRIPNGPKYHKYSDGVLRAAINKDWDSIRSAREGENRHDRYQDDSAIPDFAIVWRREYIMDIEGEDWIWWTLGGELMLTDPAPMDEVYPYGRPFVMGTGNIEALKVMPAGKPKLLEGLIDEANDLANLRYDNLRLSILRRNLVKRNAGVDIRALTRGTPGGTILMNELDAVKFEAPKDVTKSAYEEQDRLNMDMDDLTGAMDKGTVSSARNLGDTVGGITDAREGSDVLSDFTIRTIILTWAEPVLRMIVDMETLYESDAKILAIAAQENDATSLQAFRALQEDVTVTINIGFGATSPFKRISKIMMATNTVKSIVPPEIVAGMDHSEFIRDVYGAVGMDGGRYFPQLRAGYKEDPQVTQLKQKLQQAMQMIEGKQMEIQGRVHVALLSAQASIAVAKIKEGVSFQTLRIDQQWKQFEARILAMEKDLDQQESALDQIANQAEMDNKRREIMMQKEALNMNVIENARRYEIELKKLAQSSEGGGNSVTPGALETGAMDLMGNDMPGIITRENFDLIPGSPA